MPDKKPKYFTGLEVKELFGNPELHSLEEELDAINIELKKISKTIRTEISDEERDLLNSRADELRAKLPTLNESIRKAKKKFGLPSNS